ncbi:MarR family winged helix-turn-helix transcriptional regulator [Lachnospiraceae bacterium C1.1]|nr:MarR family transcriptional regulator [Lachnospiraceae bacterium C1.1]
MDNTRLDCMKIEEQLCFPLYACSKEIVRKYKPFLDELGLTYTQYITMIVLWEKKETNVKELGERLYLDSGTLTPLLKKLESKGYITRKRSTADERNLLVKITEEGMGLGEKAKDIPERILKAIGLDQEEVSKLHEVTYDILERLN